MTTSRLGLPEMVASQSQKHLTHNDALVALDGVVQLSVLDRDLASPPIDPNEGDCYIIASAPTGDWADKANQVAYYTGDLWLFHVPTDGWLAWVIDEQVALVYNVSGSWQPEIYSRGSILGVVSQAAGVPTGAVVEEGSNADGSYTRWADGTQICRHILDLGSILAFGAGTFASPYRTSYASWTFPKAFIDGNWTLVTAGQTAVATTSGLDQLLMTTGGHPGLTLPNDTARNIQAARLSDSSTAGDVVAHCVAIGRWF